MQNHYIYSVGKADLGAKSIEAIHHLGFKAGLLADRKSRHKFADAFDRVIEIDFDSLEDELGRMDNLNLEMSGLICTYENYVTAKAIIGEHFSVPAISLASAKASTDKALMRQRFIDYDTSISPQFAAVADEQELLAFARGVKFPLILKPAHLVKSLLVMRCNDERELLDNYRYAKESIAALYEKYNIYGRTPTIIVEEFITGQMYSLAAFVDEKGAPYFCPGAVRLTTAQQRAIDDNYLYQRELPAAIDPKLHDELVDVATKGIAALGMTSSPAHVELIESDGEVKIIEIGARIGGYRPRMYRLGYDIDMTLLEIQTAIGRLDSIAGELESHVAVFELFPRAEGYFKEISGVPHEEFTYFSIKAKPGDKIGPAKQGYKAAAVVTVAASDSATHERLCDLVGAMCVEVTS